MEHIIFSIINQIHITASQGQIIIGAVVIIVAGKMGIDTIKFIWNK